MSWLRRLGPQHDPQPAATCASCAHFDNAPASIEFAFGNLAAMSSGWASVRARDGLCAARGIYLSAGGFCSSHRRYDPSPVATTGGVGPAAPDLGLELTPLV